MLYKANNKLVVYHYLLQFSKIFFYLLLYKSSISRQLKFQILLQDFDSIIKDELNIKNIEFIKDETVLNDEYLMVNFKVAGKILKEKIQQFKEKIERLTDDEMRNLVNKYNDEAVNEIEFEEFGKLEKDVFVKSMKPKKHIVVIKNNGYTVALDTTLNEELIVEGMYRDLVRTIQVLRKEAGLKVEQRINLALISKGDLMKKVINTYIDKVISDTLTNEFKTEAFDKTLITKVVKINDEFVEIQIQDN